MNATGSDRGQTIQRLTANSVGVVDITGDPRVKAMAECLMCLKTLDCGDIIEQKESEGRTITHWINDVLKNAGFEVMK